MELITNIARGALGIAVLLGICYALSKNRKAINWRLVGGGVTLQLILCVAILKVPFIYTFFKWIADLFVKLLDYTQAGATFIFGSWPDEAYIQAMDFSNGQHIMYKVGYMFAFKVLPTVVFFSAFSSILFYFGILQRIIYGFAWLMSKFMRLSGAETMAAAANVFIGQTEAPLVIKPYLEKMTPSEIMCLMTGGMATIAGGVFALFVALLGPEFAIHFLTASIMSAPAAIVAAKMLYPQEDAEELNTNLEVPRDKVGNNLLDAISLGTTDGVRLAVNVGAMLLVFIALIALLNGMLGWAGDVSGLNLWINYQSGGQFSSLSLESILGFAFAPVSWLLGVPNPDLMIVGTLLGKKTAINEVVAYTDLSVIQASAHKLNPKSVIIATYALCGFSNFSSIGIQIGGISALAPSQRKTLTELGIKALIGGTVACFMTAAVAGMLA
ncbi:MAG: Na+ dependent nucleoside transporter [Lewinellaceae bacterium]|nr:Na+ dependent nucleoside transporter [Lewinella sp.]MCB9280295.1 Na+ dependent nucleoside transporter [Lewinellaceae bacterium]